MESNLVFEVALQITDLVGDQNAKTIISYTGSARAAFETPKARLLRIPGIGEKTATEIASKRTLNDAEKIIKTCQSQNIRILHYLEKDYPVRLKHIPDAPNILYVKGSGDPNPEKSVSIVGTRKASDYGKQVTEQLVKELADMNNICVYSGLAYGIDICAHKSCLSSGLNTHAVLAGGLDKIYPAAHKKYAEQIMESGLIISENPPGTKPEAHLFPARNRIIAGLSDTCIVIEAAAKGGALITANIADSYDRPVFAVPGDLDRPNSIGCNNLIRTQKALIYTGLKDINYYLNWDITTDAVATKVNLDEFEGDDKMIVELLQSADDGIHIDAISWKCQMNINTLAATLLNLEFSGVIKSLPGKRYKLAL
ncbi:MAG: DNA-processing protein DprA [Cyclobacteriaceae bacterium]